MEPRLEFAFESRLKLAPRLRLDNPPVGGARLSVPSRASLKVLAALKTDFASDGFDIVTDESPEAFRRVIQADIAKWDKVIKAAGIPPQ